MLRQNLFFMLVCLAAGTGIYVLSDLFDRLDDFLEAGLGAGTIVTYFLVKTPLILSQILPAVFLLAAVIQLSLMARNRELTALQSSGVSFAAVARVLLVYGLVWAALQLGFSQFLGVQGEQEARRIWKEEVRNKQMDNRVLEGVWFREGRQVFRLDTVWPRQERGQGVTVYVLAEGRMALTRIVEAESFAVRDGTWVLQDVRELDPGGFVASRHQELVLDVRQDVQAFLAVDPRTDPAQLPLWQLGAVIDQLRASGSNVESLRAAWHMKLAYACSLVVMALVAMALVTIRDNVYLNIALSMVVTFAFYGTFVVGVSAAQKGLAPPIFGAWAGNLAFGLLAGGRVAWFTRTRG
jgi:lipopolysaccharide export system permease protein